MSNKLIDFGILIGRKGSTKRFDTLNELANLFERKRRRALMSEKRCTIR